MPAEALQLGFQLTHSLLKFRQAIQCCHRFEPLTIVDGWISGKHGPRRNIVGYSALRGEDRAVAYTEVAGRTNLPGKNTAIANFCRSRQANLTAKHRVGSDMRGMPHQDKIIQLGATPDARFADGGAVDTRIGLHLDVVFKNRGAGLLHLVPSPIFLLGEAQAVTADNGSILQNHTISNLAELADHGV